MKHYNLWTTLTVVVMICLIAAISAPAYAEKHAVLVYDADTKRVLYEENGYSRRYPASLTKMMTLYMLFEQMRVGNVRKNTSMTASKHAASQPQTNISLRTGNKITVDQAIRALVVRSANDVAVVVAEHLGKTQKNFALMATRKARQLGMKDTVFKNPHGLPDSRQVTTAKDMALLGAALRRDFPQYYHYFSVKKFTYNGKPFKSHNRVLNKLPGVDGIKTGYIRASGFNLVSSLKHRGNNIVAVVMGGTSSSQRDARMVKLLERTHTTLLAQRSGKPVQVAFAPSPMAKPLSASASPVKTLDKLIATSAASIPVNVADASPTAIQTAYANTLSARSTIRPTPKPALVPAQNQEVSKKQEDDDDGWFNISIDFGNKPTPPVKQASPQSVNTARPAASLPKHTLDYQLAALSHDFPVPSKIDAKGQSAHDRSWAVQVGVFRDTVSAKKVLSNVARKARYQLRDAVAYVEYADQQERGFHRARLKNLTWKSADEACKVLLKMNQDCFVTRVN